MHEEQALMAKGYPLEDAITMCSSMRRTGELSEFMENLNPNKHFCACGGKGNCSDCPNYKK